MAVNACGAFGRALVVLSYRFTTSITSRGVSRGNTTTTNARRFAGAATALNMARSGQSVGGNA